MLSIPHAIAALGWLVGIVALVLGSLGAVLSGLLLRRLYLHCMEAHLKCKDGLHDGCFCPAPQTYPDIGAAAYGEVGRWVVMVVPTGLEMLTEKPLGLEPPVNSTLAWCWRGSSWCHARWGAP